MKYGVKIFCILLPGQRNTPEPLEVTGEETAFHLSFLPASLIELSLHSFHSLIQWEWALFLCQALTKLWEIQRATRHATNIEGPTFGWGERYTLITIL